MPDRLPSLILLVGCWVPAALAGRSAATFVHRRAGRMSTTALRAGLAAFVVSWTTVWFLANRMAIPPYLPGATHDPTFAPPEAVTALVLVTTLLVLPINVAACALAYRRRTRVLRQGAAT